MIKKVIAFGIVLVFLLGSFAAGITINLNDSVQHIGRGNTLYVGGSESGNYSSIQDAIDNSSNGDNVFVYNGTYIENVIVNKTINLTGEDRESTIIDGGGSGDVVYVSKDWVNITRFCIQNSGSDYTGDAGLDIHSNFNTIFFNKIISNNGEGINIESSNNNQIFHNNFIDNLQNAYDEGNNTWDDGYPSSGNYWDDYNGIDSDGDGIGDKPYNISGGNNKDNYPLMKPWGENPPVANFTHSGNESPVLFNGSLSYDRDGIIVNWTWAFGDGTTGYGIYVNHSYSATGIYNVMLTITDDDGYKDIIIQIIEIEVINQPPCIPFINGPKFGKPRTVYPYTLISIDPEREDVFYEIDWGDGSTEPWDGPYESNTLVIKDHEWEERGIYIIRARAKDENGTIGEWGILLVTMPRYKSINLPFLNWFQQHPNMFSILQMLLQRFEL
jgi:parallel beta-helix repeat protein